MPFRPSFVSRILPLLALLLALPKGRAAAQGSALERNVDPAVLPGDDFFGHANGAWLKNARIPEGRNRWGAREEIGALTRDRLMAVLEQADAAPAGSLGRQIADFRAAYLDEATIESRGLTGIAPLLAEIDQLRDRAALTRYLGRTMLADVDPMNWGIYRSASILGLSVEEGLNGESTNVPFLLQGGLGLPDRDDYLSTAPDKVELRAKYLAYVERLLVAANVEHAETRAPIVLALETAIAATQATAGKSAQDHNADSLWTRADFARRAPGMDWSAFFSAAGVGQQPSFIAWQPSALTGVARLVGERPLDEWREYLRVRMLDRYADLLPKRFADAALEMHGAAATPRTQRALAATQAALGEGIGRLYAERYFPAAQKERVRAIVANVKTAFLQRVEAATWMAPATKATALAKIRALYVGIGYPERWQDYHDLAVDPKDALGNALRAEARARRRALARLGRPVDRTEWWMTPQTAGAVLIFQLNAYDFTAALLVAPKFDSAGTDAAAYGAIGSIIGHDVSHYVDQLGADYALNGAARNWWTTDDKAGFERLTQPLVDQVAAYRPLPDATIDGMRTRTENVADLAGLVAAFDAHRLALGDRVRDTAYVRAQDREFFLAYAAGWRSDLNEAGLRAVLATDNHAPDRYRVALVRNLDAWYAAFDVHPGQALYLAPAARVRVW